MHRRAGLGHTGEPKLSSSPLRSPMGRDRISVFRAGHSHSSVLFRSTTEQLPGVLFCAREWGHPVPRHGAGVPRRCCCHSRHRHPARLRERLLFLNTACHKKAPFAPLKLLEV